MTHQQYGKMSEVITPTAGQISGDTLGFTTSAVPPASPS